jgi:hypothetical protein
MTADAFNTSVTHRRLGLQYLLVVAAAASVAALIILVSVQLYGAAIILVLSWATAAIVAAVGTIGETARSRLAAMILVVWFATTPVAWFFIRFPPEKSIVTYERLVFGLVGLLGFSRLVGRHQITGFEAVWLLLALMACFSALAFADSTGYAFKTAVDAFALPLVAFYAARTYLQSPEHRRYLVVTAMVLGLFLLGAGAFELLTGINLLPYEGSEIIREGELRVNGPFITDTSYAVVSLILALFLRSAPRMFNLGFDAGARLLYRLGMAAAMLACLLPLFRAVGVALAICWAAEGILTTPKQHLEAGGPATGCAPSGSSGAAVPARKLLRRLDGRIRPVFAVAIASLLLVAAVMVLAPRTIKDRLVSPRNAYGRVLSWRLAANIIYHHPVIGVGLSNYEDYFDKEYSGGRSALELELDTHIVKHPHSNMVWIAVELGLVGLALYLAANLLLLVPAWRALRRGQGGRARSAAACFIVLLAAYWIPGLELTSGMYSELNLYFFFLLGLIFPLLSSEQPSAGQAPNNGEHHI